MNGKAIRKALTHFAIVLFALEVRHFFDKGGSQHELSYSLLKLLLLVVFAYVLLNMENVSKVIVEKIGSVRKIHNLENDIPILASKIFPQRKLY
jgi:hypothetical protein